MISFYAGDRSSVFLIPSLAMYVDDQMDRMSQNGLKFLPCLLMGEEGMPLVDGSVVLFLVHISQMS